MSDERFDIEHFPTSPTALRMMSRISPIYDRSYVGKWIFQVMGLEMDEVRLRFGELQAQAFPETATWSLAYWEQRYGITGTEGKDIALRRQEVLSRRGARAPLNPKKMEAILSALTGREVIVTEDVAPYTFAVEIMDGVSAFDYAETVKRIKNTKPSHQAFTVQMSFPSPKNGTAVFTESHLTVEVWPDTVQAVELAPARVGVLGGVQSHCQTAILPSSVTMAGAQQDTILRAWPGAVERAEARSGAAAAEISQTIEIWP